jgi:hypothetical protein
MMNTLVAKKGRLYRRPKSWEECQSWHAFNMIGDCFSPSSSKLKMAAVSFLRNQTAKTVHGFESTPQLAAGGQEMEASNKRCKLLSSSSM